MSGTGLLGSSKSSVAAVLCARILANDSSLDNVE